MLLFRSEEHAQRWSRARDRPIGGFLTLEQQWELSSAWFGDRLDPDRPRRTPEEAQAIFERIGLTGPFWRLAG